MDLPLDVPRTIESIAIGRFAEAGQLLQRFLGFEPQAASFPTMSSTTLSCTLRVNALEVPGPSCLFVIEHEANLLGSA